MPWLPVIWHTISNSMSPPGCSFNLVLFLDSIIRGQTYLFYSLRSLSWFVQNKTYSIKILSCLLKLFSCLVGMYLQSPDFCIQSDLIEYYNLNAHFITTYNLTSRLTMLSFVIIKNPLPSFPTIYHNMVCRVKFNLIYVSVIMIFHLILICKYYKKCNLALLSHNLHNCKST